MGARGLSSQASRGEADERLLVEAAQKDPTRFGELYENHFERVYAYVARRVTDREETEDLTSEVFHRALASLPQFEWRGAPFAAWLLKIAANAIVDRSKRAAKERQFYGVDDPPEVSSTDIERRAWLYRLVDELPADQRHVIVARFAEQKSIREIARELGRTEGAVKQLQFRGLEKLRASMGESNG